MIKKRGSKFVVTNKAGTKVLGTHPSKEAAAKQLAAIEISKAKHMSEQKRFKAFRSELNESEYKETLTGYPNRGIDTDVGAVKQDADTLQKINGVLAALGRYTYQHTAEAMIKIRTRLNLFMIDFPWTPWMWQSNPTGTFTLNATLFGRVDGVDGMSGNIRFDGKANPNAGMKEFALVVTVEPAEDGFYRVNAKLQPQIAVMPEGVEHDGDTIEEDLQTPARQRDMEHAIQRAEDKASRGYEAKMTKTGKAAARGRKQEAKYDAAARRLIKKDQKEYSSLRKTYGRGGKPVKEATEPIEEDLQTPERFRQVTREQEKLRSEFEKRFEKLYKKGARERYSKKLYGKDGKVVKGKRKPVKEEAEQIEEMLKAGDKVKVPHKGKMVRGRIVRHDSGGSGKAQQHGGGYVVDVGEYGSITVPGHKVVKEAASGFSRKTLDSYIAKRGSQLSSMLSGHTRGKQLTGKQQANAVKGIKAAMAAKTTNEEVVDEALIGGQKKLDVNKNKRLDSQDFAMLRAKKKPVQEQEQKKPWWMTSTAAELAAAAQSASDARKGEEAEKRKRHAQQNRRMKWTLADKAQGKKTVKEAAMGKPKKMIPVTKTKDGKKVSTKLIPAYTPKKAVNEYTEMMGGIPLTTPDPTIAMADKSGKGKRFHKGAIKSVAEAVAKGKKAKKPSTHQGAANVIGKQKAIKSRLEKHDMRW
jgi:hypothetical protein